MKAFSLKEIKAELSTLSAGELVDINIRLAKYKKENKELLTYILFYKGDETAYIKEVEESIELHFKEINRSNLYLTKKMLRKILRTTNRFIKFSGSKQTEVELLIFFLKKIKDSGIPVHTSNALENIYLRLIVRIQKSISMLHEDLQYDYSVELQPLL